MKPTTTILFGALACAAANAAVPALVPAPTKVQPRSGVCVLKSAEVSPAVVSFAKDAKIPAEGYRLSVAPDGVKVTSSDDAGAFYALQTLKQLAQPAGGQLAVGCVEIEDSPAFAWRGVMVDDARHFMGKEAVMKVIDVMAFHKMNVLHWHLVDDQGWRLEIKRHPELVQYGATRPCSVVYGGRPSWPAPDHKIHYDLNTEKYGPFFYTHEDVKDVVAYAKARHVRIVPEIELPGHERALLAAHPELSCVGESLPRVPRLFWSIEDDVLCAGNDATLRLMEDVFDEVCALFPESPIIHVGGDECPKVRWKACPKCQARIKAEGLKDEAALQAWMTTHFARYMEKKGRRILGWDEILNGDIPKSSISMSWRMSSKGGDGKANYVSAAESAARGYDVVMSPGKYCYLDKPQGLADDPYPYYSPTSLISLEMVYSFNPREGVAEKDAAHILGAQANMWTESIWNRFDLEWKLWPRGCALAEVLWTGPGKRTCADFLERMKSHRPRLVKMQVNCAPLR